MIEPALIVYEDPCRTKKFNVVKLKLVQKFYGLNLSKQDLPDLIDLYVDWRDTVEFIPMRMKYRTYNYLDLSGLPVSPEKWIFKFNENTGLRADRFNENPDCNAVVYEGFRHQWINKKSVKRGNDIYVSLLKKKFSPLIESSKNVDFFSTVLNEKRSRVRHTRMLYLSGTCEHAKTGDIVASWISFGLYWNSYITSLKDIFGKTAHIRTWQSQKNGFPHFHALIYFFDFEFSSIYWEPDDSWRIHNTQKVIVNRKTGEKDFCRDVIKNRWKWGHLDVKCCDSSKSALKDLLKYVLRDLEGGESDLTNALVWYFRKKSFAVSRSFLKLFGVGAFEEPENADLINGEAVIQEAIQEDELVSIDVFPLIPRDMLPFYSQLTLKNWDDPPDPPPEMVDFLDNFALSCVPSISRINSDGVSVTIYKFREEY